jgi:drug/metabolite transporter (DMT)-like permease
MSAEPSSEPDRRAPGRRFAMPVPSREQVRAGIFYMVASVFLSSVINALIKWEGARYPVGEVAFFRCAFSLLPCLALLVGSGAPRRLLRTQRLRAHIGIGVLQFVSMMCLFLAFGRMPLADAVAITFSTPMFLTLLSIPMLGERVGRHRWAAVLLGFVGVLLMIRAGGALGGGLASMGALLALATAAISAHITILVRRMTLTDSSAALVIYQTLILTALTAALLPFDWQTPIWQDALLLAGTGFLAGIGQFWWTQAFRFAPAAVAAPFSYLAMVWSLALGYLVWGDVPTSMLIAGAVVVVVSGLYILYRETVRGARHTTAVVAGSD